MKYVPILKARQAEYNSLRNLTTAEKKKIMPVMEIPALPYDFVEEKSSTTLDAHIAKFVEKILVSWTAGLPIAVDVHESIVGEKLSTGDNPIAPVKAVLEGAGFNVSPVVDFEKPDDYISAVKKSVGGACLRIYANDFGRASLAADIDALLKRLVFSKKEVDLLIDFGPLQSGQEGTIVLAVQGGLALIPDIKEWRSVSFAGSAFPKDMTGFAGDTVTRIPRTEWLAWKGLNGLKLPRSIQYGDYTISHPDGPTEIDPRLMTITASLRYTTGDDWLILKGRAIKLKGSGQYIDICKTLMKMKEYAGETFSKGDEAIAKCARKESGPGNAAIWRHAGVSHHLAVVLSQI